MDNPELDLVVAWRVGRNIHAGPIDISGDVAHEFLELIDSVNVEVSSREAIVSFDPDTEYADDSPVLRATADDLVDKDLIELLLEAHVNENVTANDLANRRAHLYALSTVRGEQREVYVRASSPVKFAGKSIRGRLTDSFDRITEPILVFDAKFDFVIRASEILIFNASSFERITNSREAAAAASERLVSSLVANLPIAEAGREALEASLSTNSFMRRKALSVINKPYLRDLTMDRVHGALKKHDLVAAEYLKDNELVFTSDNTKTLLALLNDDIFSGDFSGVEYAAARKSTL